MGNAPDILILTQVFSITNKPKGEIVLALVLQKKAVIIIKCDVQLLQSLYGIGKLCDNWISVVISNTVLGTSIIIIH